MSGALLRIEVMHGVNLDQLGHREAEHYGDHHARPARAPDLGLRRRARPEHPLLPDQLRERVRRASARRARSGRRHPAEPGRVDALLVGHPRRAGDRQPARGRGAPLRRRRARGVPPGLGDPRPVRRDGQGQGPDGYRDALVRLQRGACPGMTNQRAGERRDRAARARAGPAARVPISSTSAGSPASPARRRRGRRRNGTRRFITDFRYLDASPPSSSTARGSARSPRTSSSSVAGALPGAGRRGSASTTSTSRSSSTRSCRSSCPATSSSCPRAGSSRSCG